VSALRNEIEKLAEALRRVDADRGPSEVFGWPTAPLNVIDCVLSLNRNYERFSRPRVELFAERHPALVTLAGLEALILSYESPLEFSVHELDYRHEARAETLLGVVRYLLDVQTEFEGHDEMARLCGWAEWSRPGDYLMVGVKGFGLAGFQYLRMLLGAQTTKPDVHIKSFVSGVVGRRVSDIEAVMLLERASRRAGLPLRALDHEIWRRLRKA